MTAEMLLPKNDKNLSLNREAIGLIYLDKKRYLIQPPALDPVTLAADTAAFAGGTRTFVSGTTYMATKWLAAALSCPASSVYQQVHAAAEEKSNWEASLF